MNNSSNGFLNAFRWLPGGKIAMLTSLYGGNSYGYGIDDNQNVVGTMAQISLVTHPGRWSSTAKAPT